MIAIDDAWIWMTGKSGPCQRSPSTLAAGREWKCPRNLLAQSPVRSIQAQTLRDVTVLSNDSQEAPINQRHWRRGSVTHDGEADKSPMRVCGFLRHTPMSNQSGRRNAAPARISRQEPDTPLAHRRPEYPLAGCFPAEPASVSSGKVISTQYSRECNHWTSEYA